ncbi:MAG: large-conductance mechanosensitive channel protein MscL [Phycisphaerae bacterium]|nr:large-conductance mechanosensitive channel protein MscL [Phycisphaerae bacterium]
MSLVKEFKAFAMRGNVVDMAVGIIIGGAFGKIVASLVNDVIMPPIGMLIGGVDFANLKLVLKKETLDAVTGNAIPAVTIGYGAFINTVINFLIIALAIFAMIKIMNASKKKEEAKPAPAPSDEVKLLAEIRDALKSR